MELGFYVGAENPVNYDENLLNSKEEMSQAYFGLCHVFA